MMAVDTMGFIPMLCLALLVITVAGRAIESNVSGADQMQNDGVVKKAEDGLRKYNGPAVHHFAKHGLCNHSFGKIRFFRALQKHFHNISDDMKIAFVLDVTDTSAILKEISTDELNTTAFVIPTANQQMKPFLFTGISIFVADTLLRKNLSPFKRGVIGCFGRTFVMTIERVSI
ncbi:hypothetical protein MAR_035715 [Mya arenaria]|uniref:Uncharacterized protein n=1 Tax=Mya arenaria TaxID=6604 RepID=A0ABY7EQG3_MYAAR|nr:hypothetical protein MAR_035715 [Mya arenaria]